MRTRRSVKDFDLVLLISNFPSTKILKIDYYNRKYLHI